MNTRLSSLFALAILLVAPLFGQSAVNVAGASNVAVNGYDTVAFFTESKPVHGSLDYSAEYQGATYYFANAKHQKLFKANPERYAPQCGGYCAYGASLGYILPVDVNTWVIVDDKLYLNLNPDIAKAFGEDLSGNIAKAQAKWPELAKSAR
ncbi:YHS domain-containing (seleno)protein [Actomonas aquatica]|uniref:YHS domain-containing (Seleno)protein n=1 Tax=Actomonas aquatica TaxID=2866162 RepID=A0ABZ1C4C7_9BACT|nr:YHS domain-containing (seleno)protein [Opitutus sp. WL0086]WRQ86212.1 YHS domain-containing (seleno)protein [Opitutus sp. WL0086]